MTAVLVGLLTTLAAPILARRVLPARSWGPHITAWVRAAYGILPLYGAWVSGAVVARDAGLRAIEPLRWVFGLFVCSLAVGALWLLTRRPSVGAFLRRWFLGEAGWWPLLDEPRWGFYRAAAAAVLPQAVVAQPIGLTLGAVEWLIRQGRPTSATPPEQWAVLVRLSVSAGLFALTGNLWLVVGTMAAARAMLLRR